MFLKFKRSFADKLELWWVYNVKWQYYNAVVSRLRALAMWEFFCEMCLIGSLIYINTFGDILLKIWVVLKVFSKCCRTGWVLSVSQKKSMIVVCGFSKHSFHFGHALFISCIYLFIINNYVKNKCELKQCKCSCTIIARKLLSRLTTLFYLNVVVIRWFLF